MDIRIKRIYEAASDEDGARILVDRLWPRGVAKDDARLDVWLKDAAPSPELRSWFGHEPARFDAFRERYERELDDHPDDLTPIVDRARAGRATLLYAARDPDHNHAVVLRDYIRSRFDP